jgi:hypothetical protein
MAKLKVVDLLLERRITLDKAADVLRLSARQVLRIKRGVIKCGPSAIIHKNRAGKPANTLPEALRQKIVQLKTEKYPKANFSHYQRILAKYEGIHVSVATVHRILGDASIKSPKKHKMIKLHRRRERKPAAGIMAQIDASPYEWIEGIKSSLHGAIDDATGHILGLYMTEEECLEGYFNVFSYMAKKYGIPLSTYQDKHTIFFSPVRKLSIEEELEGKTEALTQFGKAMDELGVAMIEAGSPQAKGRIERLWGTLQSILPVEFIINGIKDIDSANRFLLEGDFIDELNQLFGKEPKESISAFRKLPKEINLDYVLCRKEVRKFDRGSSFSYKGNCYMILKDGKAYATMPRSSVNVLESPRIGLKAKYRGKVYELLKIDIKPKIDKDTVKPKIEKKYKPAADHPWKIGKIASGTVYRGFDRDTYYALLDSKLAWKPDSYIDY